MVSSVSVSEKSSSIDPMSENVAMTLCPLLDKWVQGILLSEKERLYTIWQNSSVAE